MDELRAEGGQGITARLGPTDHRPVGIRTAPTFSFGTPKRLFAAPFESFGFTGYDVSADDQRFLMIRNLSADAPDKLIVVENWFEELKTRRRD